MSYLFTNSWFSSVAEPNWKHLIPQIRPSKVLEIGSYEGASTVFLIDLNTWTHQLEIVCVDTWAGGVEHQERGVDMSEVETRFDQNIRIATAKTAERQVAIRKRKGFSDVELSKLIAEGEANSFDLVYVDGSHQAPDVLLDAILGYKLCKPGGFIFFDDYLWHENLSYGVDPIRSPKIAIDSFTNIYCRNLKIVRAPLYQLYVQKLS